MNIVIIFAPKPPRKEPTRLSVVEVGGSHFLSESIKFVGLNAIGHAGESEILHAGYALVITRINSDSGEFDEDDDDVDLGAAR